MNLLADLEEFVADHCPHGALTGVATHGHSWGGYQTAFTVTQTNIFAAAIAGALLTDMISMYSIIYKNTGGTNGAIFESSQGRFTSGPWDNWAAYTRNSPVAPTKNVQTPLMILATDADGAVDFTQDIEYYDTLRRLGKPVVLLEYPGENHSLARPANQQDKQKAATPAAGQGCELLT